MVIPQTQNNTFRYLGQFTDFNFVKYSQKDFFKSLYDLVSIRLFMFVSVDEHVFSTILKPYILTNKFRTIKKNLYFELNHITAAFGENIYKVPKIGIALNIEM